MISNNNQQPTTKQDVRNGRTRVLHLLRDYWREK